MSSTINVSVSNYSLRLIVCNSASMLYVHRRRRDNCRICFAMQVASDSYLVKNQADTLITRERFPYSQMNRNARENNTQFVTFRSTLLTLFIVGCVSMSQINFR